MQSIKSNALEPTRSELRGLSRWQQIIRVLPVYGLPLLTLLLIIFFSLLLPATFPTYLNFRSILADKAIIALLSLAATLPMMAGRIDLTVGFGIVMWHILAMWLLVKTGVPWPLAIIIVVACGGLVGLVNGLLVEVAQIDSSSPPSAPAPCSTRPRCG
jgi:ribose transport system permease protein